MFRFDRKILFIIIGIMAISFLSTLTSAKILSLLLTIPGVLIAMTFHEFAHAFAADKLGDDTPRMQGRLNLNPFSHIDVIGFTMLILAGFGWGKPVAIDPRNFNRNMSLTKAEAIVAAAGPIMNFILGFVLLLIYGALIKFNFVTNEITYYIALAFELGAQVNLGLGVFNLIPLPPLDGSKILYYFLNINQREWFENNQQYFYIGFVIIFITGLAGSIISPVISWVYSGYLELVKAIFNLM